MQLRGLVILSGFLGLAQLAVWIPQLLIVGYHMALFIAGCGAIVGLVMSFVGLMKEKKNAQDPGVDAFNKPAIWIMVLIMAILLELIWIATLVVNIIVFGPLLGDLIYLCYVFAIPGAALAAVSISIAIIGLVRVSGHPSPTDYRQI